MAPDQPRIYENYEYWEQGWTRTKWLLHVQGMSWVASWTGGWIWDSPVSPWIKSPDMSFLELAQWWWVCWEGGREKWSQKFQTEVEGWSLNGEQRERDREKKKRKIERGGERITDNVSLKIPKHMYRSKERPNKLISQGMSSFHMNYCSGCRGSPVSSALILFIIH